MAIEVRATQRIRRSPAEVAAYVTDPRNDTAWIGGIKAVEADVEGPAKAGSRVKRRAAFMGKQIEYVNEVVEVDDSHLTMRSVQAPFPMRVTYGFEADRDGATRASVRVEGDPSGVYSFGGPLMAFFVKRSISGDLKRLKRILEDGTPRRDGA